MANSKIDFDEELPPPDRITVRDVWRSYYESAFPEGAHPVQIQAMRDAFYAGWLGCHCVVRRLGGDDISEGLGVEVLEKHFKELERYKDQVMRRRH